MHWALASSQNWPAGWRPHTFITVVIHEDDFLQQVGRRVVDRAVN